MRNWLISGCRDRADLSMALLNDEIGPLSNGFGHYYMLAVTSRPRSLWGEAARHVMWLMNRTPTKAVNGKTPFEAAFGTKPDLAEVREWGEKIWVRIEGGDKLGGRVKEG